MRKVQINKLTGKNSKKWWFVGLCSFAVLGGIGVYSYGMQPQQKIAEKEHTSLSGEKVKKTWEKQIEKETRKNEAKKEKAKTPIDRLLEIVSGDTENERIFGFKVKEMADSTLVGQLANAIEKQEAKEQQRTKNKNELVLLDKEAKDDGFLSINYPSKPKDDSEIIVKPTLPEEPGGGEQEAPEWPITKPENPGTPEPLPEPTPDPEQPIPTPLPDPLPMPTIPTPDPEPLPPVEPENPDHSLEEKINESKSELKEAKEKADQLNDQLTQVKQELDHLNHIEETTNQQAEKATNEWKSVADLITEYNQLSTEIKKLIEENGSVLPINYELYQEMYQKLSQKVDEIKKTQSQANQTTDQMNKDVQQAEETATSLPEKTQAYEDVQSQVEDAASKVQSSVSNAQKDSEVANALQPEMDQATQAGKELEEVNQSVGQQLEESSQSDYSSALDAANQTAEKVNQEAEKQNDAVEDVLNDFENLPSVEETNEPDSSQSSVPQSTDPDTTVSAEAIQTAVTSHKEDKETIGMVPTEKASESSTANEGGTL